MASVFPATSPAVPKANELYSNSKESNSASNSSNEGTCPAPILVVLYSSSAIAIARDTALISATIVDKELAAWLLAPPRVSPLSALP